MHYPDEAGYPFGEDSAPTYFLMEVHYDNPQLLSGRKDNSGYQIGSVCISTLPINMLIHNVIVHYQIFVLLKQVLNSFTNINLSESGQSLQIFYPPFRV